MTEPTVPLSEALRALAMTVRREFPDPIQTGEDSFLDDDLDTLAQRAASLEAAVKAVCALHVTERIRFGDAVIPCCTECSAHDGRDIWPKEGAVEAPCPTRRALDAALGGGE